MSSTLKEAMVHPEKLTVEFVTKIKEELTNQSSLTDTEKTVLDLLSDKEITSGVVTMLGMMIAQGL